MKGDADELRADVDDGYARISLLLIEALACAPLTDYEHSVVWFVMRRTYGWARKDDRGSGKLDAMTAAEIARATNRPRRTVEKAIARLVGAAVLIKHVLSSDNRCAYGINPDVAQWGGPGPIWTEWYITLQRNREDDTYTPTSVHLYADGRISIRQIAYTYTPDSVDSPPTNPRAPGLSFPLTESLDRENVNTNVNDSTFASTIVESNATEAAQDTAVAPAGLDEDPFAEDGTPAALAAPGQAEPTIPPSDSAEPKPRKPRAETPEQQAIHRLWDAFELPGGPTPPKGVKPGYSSVLKQLTDNGIPLFDELSAHVAADPTARLPEGAAPWGWFCTQVRRYVAAPWKWQTEQSNQLAHAAKPFQLLNDGTRCYADDWNLTQQYYIGEWQREGVWDARTGCTTQPRTGACCTDGWYYANDDSGTLQQERRWAAT